MPAGEAGRGVIVVPVVTASERVVLSACTVFLVGLARLPIIPIETSRQQNKIALAGDYGALAFTGPSRRGRAPASHRQVKGG